MAKEPATSKLPLSLSPPRSLFPLGQVCATPLALDLLTHWELAALLTRHATGDYGDLCPEDRSLNNVAVQSQNERVFSSYNTPKGKIWIITEADRSVTTALTPSEY